MNAYEIVYIFDTTVSEEAIAEKLERYHEIVTREGGEVTAMDQWGARQLAHPISKKTNGYYVVAQFSANPELLPEFERLLKLDEGLLRYLIVIDEGLPTAPMSVATREPNERDEDEDDEEEDEE